MKDDYGRQKYINIKTIYEARELFRTRVKMQLFAGNFKNDKRFCRCLQTTKNEAHRKFEKCPQYTNIREKYDSVDDDQTLARFFREVLARRDALDEGASAQVTRRNALCLYYFLNSIVNK